MMLIRLTDASDDRELIVNPKYIMYMFELKTGAGEKYTRIRMSHNQDIHVKETTQEIMSSLPLN